MSHIHFAKLTPNDGWEQYCLLQSINADDNGFTNTANGLTYEEFKAWLKQQDAWSRAEDLPQGYVKQTWYWLMIDDCAVGCGKIRQSLTEQSRIKGGTIGYALAPSYRGKGYGTLLLSLLLQEAKEQGVQDKVLTVEKYNYPSAKVIEKNGGVLYDENELRWYYRV
jgi:predicted acetyltransferase